MNLPDLNEAPLGADFDGSTYFEAVPTKETTGAAWAQDLPDRREALLPRLAGYFMGLAERASKRNKTA